MTLTALQRSVMLAVTNDPHHTPFGVAMRAFNKLLRIGLIAHSSDMHWSPIVTAAGKAALRDA